MTKEKLLQEFPGYKPPVFHSGIGDNYIEPVFTYYDRIELEEMYLDKVNSENIQLQLFI